MLTYLLYESMHIVLRLPLMDDSTRKALFEQQQGFGLMALEMLTGIRPPSKGEILQEGRSLWGQEFGDSDPDDINKVVAAMQAQRAQNAQQTEESHPVERVARGNKTSSRANRRGSGRQT